MTQLTPVETWATAVQSYWLSLETQALKQGEVSGVKDTGNRGAVTGGKQMDALQSVVAAIWQSDPDVQFEVRSSGQTNLPAYFRPRRTGISSYSIEMPS